MLSKATLYGKSEREDAAESDLLQVAMYKDCKEEAKCAIHQCELEDREEEGATKSSYVREDYWHSPLPSQPNDQGIIRTR